MPVLSEKEVDEFLKRIYLKPRRTYKLTNKGKFKRVK